MTSAARLGRTCSRGGCRRKATTTLTYIYSESVAVVGPLATFSEPHAYDLCDLHGDRLTVPNGWNVIRQVLDDAHTGPSTDDLMAIADAVREVANSSLEVPDVRTSSSQSAELGRRGHLRAVPS